MTARKDGRVAATRVCDSDARSTIPARGSASGTPARPDLQPIVPLGVTAWRDRHLFGADESARCEKETEVCDGVLQAEARGMRVRGDVRTGRDGQPAGARGVVRAGEVGALLGVRVLAESVPGPAAVGVRAARVFVLAGGVSVGEGEAGGAEGLISGHGALDAKHEKETKGLKESFRSLILVCLFKPRGGAVPDRLPVVSSPHSVSARRRGAVGFSALFPAALLARVCTSAGSCGGAPLCFWRGGGVRGAGTTGTTGTTGTAGATDAPAGVSEAVLEGVWR